MAASPSSNTSLQHVRVNQNQNQNQQTLLVDCRALRPSDCLFDLRHDLHYSEFLDRTPNSLRAPICQMDEFAASDFTELRRLSLLDDCCHQQRDADASALLERSNSSSSSRRCDRSLSCNQSDLANKRSIFRRSRLSRRCRTQSLKHPASQHDPLCGQLILDENFSESLQADSVVRVNHITPTQVDVKSENNQLPERQAVVNMHQQAATNAKDIAASANNGADLPLKNDKDASSEQRQNSLNAARDTVTSNTSRNLKEQLISFFQPSDNKLAMKLFGNKNALLKERKRQQQSGFAFVIHPCSDFRFYWDLVMLIVLALNVVVLPVSISFFYEDITAGWVVFNCVSDTMFILDILCNFRTGVITNDFAEQILLDPKSIAVHYIKTWFFLDIISSLPMDYVLLLINNDDNYNQLMHAGRALRILRLAKLLSLLRLLRFSRLVRYMSQWEEFLNIAAMLLRVLNLVLLILLLAHWNACLQFLIPALKEFPPDSWVALEEIERAPWVTQYTWSMFRALSHMLCIGYGKYPPQSMSDAWSTMVSMLSGAISYAMFVGHATALVQSFDTSKRIYREKWKQVEEYMAFRKLPRNLRQRISNYYEHRYQGKMFDEEAILGELSECLREQIINYNCRALVAAVPYFTHADPDFVSEVVTNLRFEVFQPEDIVIKAGTIGTKMYFIQEGTVEVILPNGTVATCLYDGAYFGEICLLVEGARRVATIKAVTYCNLYSLSNENFKQVLENYPSMRLMMEQVAQERLHKIGVNTAKLAAPSSASDNSPRPSS